MATNSTKALKPGDTGYFPPASTGTTQTPVTLYGANPQPGTAGYVFKQIFPTLPSGTLDQYKTAINIGNISSQNLVALANLLNISVGGLSFKNKHNISFNSEIIKGLSKAFGAYDSAYKGQTTGLPPLGGFLNTVVASGANLSDPTTAAQAASAAAREARQQSSVDIISEHLANMGFTDDQLKQLAPFVASQVHSGLSQTAVYANLRQTPQYAQRFPGNVERIKQGLPALNESTYIAYEDRTREIARSYGLPSAALTPQIIGNMISNGVSPTEFENRVTAGYEAMQKADPQTLHALQTYYNLNPGDIVHYIIDPKNGAAALDRKVTAAKIGGDVQAAGLQSITRQQAEDFAKFQASKGVNVAQGIQQAGQLKPLMGTAPGQARQGLTQDQLLQGAIGTTTAAQQALTSAQQAEAAPLKAGGGDVANQKGVIGAGYAAAE